jgi:hypothetical protein
VYESRRGDCKKKYTQDQQNVRIKYKDHMRGITNNRHNSDCALLKLNSGPIYGKIEGALEIYTLEKSGE